MHRIDAEQAARFFGGKYVPRYLALAGLFPFLMTMMKLERRGSSLLLMMIKVAMMSSALIVMMKKVRMMKMSFAFHYLTV